MRPFSRDYATFVAGFKDFLQSENPTAGRDYATFCAGIKGALSG